MDTAKEWALQGFVELMGTFFFLSVIIAMAGPAVLYAALAIGLALSAAVFFGGYISGGHFNPAVSTMFVINGDIKWQQYLIYIVCQVLGAVAAWGVFSGAKSVGFSAPSRLTVRP